MSNGFQTAKKSIDLSSIDLSSFNEPISNSSFMEVGEHDVTVENAEVQDYGYGPNLLITWVNASGASIKQFINLVFEDRETKEKSIAKKYIITSRLFANTIETRNKFFLEVALQDTSKFGALKGLKAHVVIAKGKKGYDITNDATSGGYVVVDVESKERLIDMVFSSMKEAAAEAKEQGLRRAFNEVAYVTPIEGEVENNERALCTALEAAESAPSAPIAQSVNML
jgi:hypothetical protein